MASVLAGAIPWHDGEEKMHTLLRVPPEDNPTVPYLSPGAAYLLNRSPLLALGTIDAEGRPWSTVVGGEAGFASPIAESIIGLQSLVDSKHDPVIEILLGGSKDGQVVATRNAGKMVSALAIDLENRKRVKLFGRMIAGSLSRLEADPSIEGTASTGQKGQAQLAVKVEGSLGNCPKYLNKKHIYPALPEPKLVTDSPILPPGAVDLLGQADCLFVSSYRGTVDMDINIRGGPQGFVRIISNGSTGAILVYPEYSGNRLYQTLGNLQTTPLAGYVFPDFKTGNVLYATGRTEILIGRAAAAILPRSNLAVKVTITAARYVEKGLCFRGIPGEPSPYNPTVRYLATEKAAPAAQNADEPSATATLVKKEVLTPTINRFRFRISDPTKIKTRIPGQYATLSFRDELDMGYSHMRDDDPTSINDDWIRTFTVSSYPGKGISANELEITVRKHGNVTRLLFQTSERAGLEVPLKGFGGSFQFEDHNGQDMIPFIAGGIGITPVIAQLPGIDASRLRLSWSVSIQDVGLILDTFQRFPQLPAATTLFITGPDVGNEANHSSKIASILESEARINRRRMKAKDLDLSLADVWYLCAGVSLKRDVLNWLAGKRIVYEDFNY